MSDRDVSPNGDDYERRRKRDRSYDDDKEDRRSGKHRSRSRSSRRHRSRSKSGSRSGKDKRYSKSYRSRSRSANSSRKRHAYGDTPDPSRCLGVFGMSLYTTDHELHHVLSKYGPLEKVNVVKDAKTGRSRGFAFAYFESLEDAKMAKEACNGIELDGRRIRCDFSITQRAHTPTPGIYMGRPTYADRERRVSGSSSSRRSPRRRSPSRDRDYSRRRDYKSRSRSYSPRRY